MSTAALATTFDYQGAPIRSRADEKVNLTDMWRAAGSPAGKRPAEWLRRESTIEFSAHLADVGQTHIDNLTENTKGGASGGGATWGHWHLAMAYARSLDHAFHVWCNDVIRVAMQDAPAAATVLHLDGTTINSARISDSPSALHRVRQAIERCCVGRDLELIEFKEVSLPSRKSKRAELPGQMKLLLGGKRGA